MTGEPELGPKSFKRTLTQFSDRDTRNVEYCALSHCWGGAKDILTLTTGTARELELGVTIESLPKTFREAVGVARDLGLRYICMLAYFHIH